jgi:hypothetical protein
MTTTLEVPFRPGLPTTPETRLEPPLVPVEPRWEYREIVRDIASGLLSEAELNQLGDEYWELAGIATAGSRIHFYFKRERRP